LESEFKSEKIDLHKFASKLCNGGELTRCYYYLCTPHLSDPPTQQELEKNAAMQKFVKAIEMLPNFMIRAGQLVFESSRNEYVQKQVDVQMAIDMVNMKDRMDKAIIVTGDMDFVPAINHLREHGVQVELVYMPTKVYRDLIKSVDVDKPITEALVRACIME